MPYEFCVSFKSDQCVTPCQCPLVHRCLGVWHRGQWPSTLTYWPLWGKWRWEEQQFPGWGWSACYRGTTWATVSIETQMTFRLTYYLKLRTCSFTEGGSITDLIRNIDSLRLHAVKLKFASAVLKDWHKPVSVTRVCVAVPCLLIAGYHYCCTSWFSHYLRYYTSKPQKGSSVQHPMCWISSHLHWPNILGPPLSRTPPSSGLMEN